MERMSAVWLKRAVLAVTAVLLFSTTVSAVPTSLKLFDSNLGMAGNRIENLGNVTLAGNMGLTGAKVGIGTSTPSQKLEVFGGNLRISNAGHNEGISINGSATTDTLKLKFQEGTTDVASLDWDNQAPDTFILRAIKSGSQLRFDTANSEAMRIDQNGNVGIGTGSPKEELDVGNYVTVRGATDATRSGHLGFNAYWNGTDWLRISGAPAFMVEFSDPDDAFHIKAAGSGVADSVIAWDDALDVTANEDVIVPNGRIGINESSPASAIHMQGNSIGRNAITHDFTDTSSTRFVRWVDSGDTEMAWLAAENMDGAGNGTIDFNGKGNVDFSLTDANLGIGTRSPDSDLDIEFNTFDATAGNMLRFANTKASDSWTDGNLVGGMEYWTGDASGPIDNDIAARAGFFSADTTGNRYGFKVQTADGSVSSATDVFTIDSSGALTATKATGSNSFIRMLELENRPSGGSTGGSAGVDIYLDQGQESAAIVRGEFQSTANMDLVFLVGDGFTGTGEPSFREGMRVRNNGHVGIGTSGPEGPLTVEHGNVAFTVREVTLNDDATVALETVLPVGQHGMIHVFDQSTASVAGTVYIRGASDAVTEVNDPLNGITTTDSDGNLNFLSDGDGTYTMKNRLGAQKVFVLQFIGSGT